MDLGVRVKSFSVGLVPFAAMVVSETALVGLSTLSKVAMAQGASHFSLVAYTNAVGFLILLPFAFFINRKNWPPLTFAFLFKVFLLSFVGLTLMQNCMFTGIGYSSPTLASALNNLIPAFTFLLAVIFRMEKLDLRSLRDQIKVMCTVVCIAGAFVATLYKGPPMVAASMLVKLQTQPQWPAFSLLATTNNWVIGGTLLAIGSLSIAVTNIYLAAILKAYPSEVTLGVFFSLFAAIQSAIVALIAERNNPGSWKIRPDIQLIVVIYGAVSANVVTFGVLAWCIRIKGPVFVAMFKPLGIFIAAVMSDIFLGETLHLGSVIGAIIIVVGFYGVMWAQSKENEYGVSSQETPLLQDYEEVHTAR